MTQQLFATRQINPLTDSTASPIFCTRGGPVTLDVPVGELFTELCCTTPGSVVIKGKDGKAVFRPYLALGAILPFQGIEVLSSAVIGGNTYTTTATGLWWYGGM